MQSLYYDSIWPGDDRDQVISSHGIDLVIPNITVSAPERLGAVGLDGKLSNLVSI